MVTNGDPSPYPNRLAQWLVEQIDRRGWSNREAGRQIGLNHVTLGQLIAGHVGEPKSDTFAKIATLFGADEATLRRWWRQPAQNDRPAEPVVISPKVLDASKQPTGYDGLRALAERFGDPRLRLAFYDFLSFAGDITPDEAASIAETLESIVERKGRGQ